MAMKIATIVLVMALGLRLVVVDGAPVAPKCQLKNGILGIKFQGEHHDCYADAANICDNLGFHIYEVKLTQECRQCCPIIITTTSKSPRPATVKTTNSPTVVTAVTTNRHHANVKDSKTWIFVIIGVFGAIGVAVAMAILAYHRNCRCPCTDGGNQEEDPQDEIDGGEEGEDVPFGVQTSDEEVKPNSLFQGH